MKGDDKVLAGFQELLDHELSARDQYLAHSRKFQDWGLNKLYAHINHEMEEEQQHVDAIVNRMLFLEQDPDYSTRVPPNVGNDVKQMLQNDLDAEVEVAQLLKNTIQVCEQMHDYDSRDILIQLLHDTEMDHIYWLEQQLGLIDKIGLENYLQSQA